MKSLTILGAAVLTAGLTAPTAQADYPYLALVVNSTNSQQKTNAFWNIANTAEAGWAMGIQDCKAKWGADGTCEEAASSTRCIGIAIGDGTKYHTAYADTAAAAYAAAQAKSPHTNAPGTGRCGDGTKLSS